MFSRISPGGFQTSLKSPESMMPIQGKPRAKMGTKIPEWGEIELREGRQIALLGRTEFGIYSTPTQREFWLVWQIRTQAREFAGKK